MSRSTGRVAKFGILNLRVSQSFTLNCDPSKIFVCPFFRLGHFANPWAKAGVLPAQGFSTGPAQPGHYPQHQARVLKPVGHQT